MSCYSKPVDLMTFATPQDKKNIIYLIPYKAKMDKAHCSVRSNLIDVAKASKVALWRKDSTRGSSNQDYRVFKHPTSGFWIMSNMLKLLTKKKQYFVLVKLGKRRIGSSFGRSTLYGVEELLYGFFRLPDNLIDTFKKGKLRGKDVKKHADKWTRVFKEVELVDYERTPKTDIEYQLLATFYNVREQEAMRQLASGRMTTVLKQMWFERVIKLDNAPFLNQLLKEPCIDPNFYQAPSPPTAGKTPISDACYYGYISIIDELVKSPKLKLTEKQLVIELYSCISSKQMNLDEMYDIADTLIRKRSGGSLPSDKYLKSMYKRSIYNNNVNGMMTIVGYYEPEDYLADIRLARKLRFSELAEKLSDMGDMWD